jgi:hypothetical protein
MTKIRRFGVAASAAAFIALASFVQSTIKGHDHDIVIFYNSYCLYLSSPTIPSQSSICANDLLLAPVNYDVEV